MLRRGAVDHALEPLDEAPLDVGEHRLDALHRLALLALERLAQLALAAPHALGQLVHGLPPLDRMRLELRARRLDRLLGRPCDLLAQLHERPALHLTLRLQALGVGSQPLLRLLDQATLPLGEALQLVEEVRLRALEVFAPRREPLLDAALRIGERVVELPSGRPLM